MLQVHSPTYLPPSTLLPQTVLLLSPISRTYESTVGSNILTCQVFSSKYIRVKHTNTHYRKPPPPPPFPSPVSLCPIYPLQSLPATHLTDLSLTTTVIPAAAAAYPSRPFPRPQPPQEPYGATRARPPASKPVPLASRAASPPSTILITGVMTGRCLSPPSTPRPAVCGVSLASATLQQVGK